MTVEQLGLEQEFPEAEMPHLIRRSGMAEWRDGEVRILDRRQLPLKVEYVICKTVDDVAAAIRDMVIQGAFSISIAAGYGLALAARQNPRLEHIKAAAGILIATRPTGLALKRVVQACLEVAQDAVIARQNICEAILETVDRAAAVLARQGYETGRIACALIGDGATILTHCFPDRSYAYLLLEAKRQGKSLNLICSETRPYLQGARLTALCAVELGFPTQVITDGMGGYLMREGIVNYFITAADRVCMDGTVCNKIGTYQYALAAADTGRPFFVLRQSGPDVESATEQDIRIEMRDGEEVVNFMGHRTAPLSAQGLYPTFDIVPPRLISKIVTDRGAFDPGLIRNYSLVETTRENTVLPIPPSV